MKRIIFIFSILFLATNLSALAKVDTEAAKSLVNRIAPEIAEKVIFEKIDGVSEKEKIVYELRNAPGGKIVVRGNTTIALTSGFYQYLKNYCNGQITWGASNLPAIKKGATLPRLSKKIRVESPLTVRYAYNYCTHGYTMSWWDWNDWEKEIDWLALHGFNLALVIQGQESVWQNTFSKFGYTKEEMRQWLCAPTHMPWQFMGNMEAMMPPPQSVVDKRTQLGQKIVARMRELGVEPVLQGYYGMVPYRFSQKQPSAKIVPQGGWAGGNKRPDMLNPADPLFNAIAKTFYEEQKKIFGECYYFAADPFHEGGQSGDMNRGTVYRQVQDAMLSFEPNATLVKQCWQTSNAEMFNAGKKDRSLALDLYGDKHPFWKHCNGYNGTPWIWCLLQNFGGNTAMEGDLRGLCNGIKSALESPNRGKLVGVGFVPEGSFNNPVIFELLSDIAVLGAVPEDLESWLLSYIRSRYGKSSTTLSKAWNILLQTAYSYTAHEGPVNSALPARPHFGKFIKARFWASNMAIPYNNSDLLKALELFSKESPKFGNKETFRYDYADLYRQVVDNLSHAIYVKINTAWDEKNKAAFDDASSDFMRLFDLLEVRFNQFPAYKNDAEAFAQSYTKWIEDAQKFGQRKTDKEYLKSSAQLLLTRWVLNPGTDLDDYAFREWTGLTGAYYAERWQMFFDDVKKALSSKSEFNQGGFNHKLNTFEKEWSFDAKRYAKRKHAPVRDALGEISALVKKYSDVIESKGDRPKDGPLGVQTR